MSDQLALTTREGVALAPPLPEDDGNDVMALIRYALHEDVGVEKLERLMALKERHDAKLAQAAYQAALTAFQAECPVIQKTRGVSFDDRAGSRPAYWYAPLEDITRAIDPILRKHGLSYSWTTAGMDNGCLNVVCKLRHIGGHEEVVPFPVPTATKAKMSAAQANGAALTYGRRQSLIAVLGLTTTDDDVDGRDVNDEEPDLITEDQARDLSAMVDEVNADKGLFLDWLGVESFAQVRVDQFDGAIKALTRKRRKA